jgi:hypothetical protein
MSPKQTKWYWREWAAVVRACKAADLPEPDRHELHREALGKDKSSKAFTNADLDKVIATFRAHSQADNIDAQLRQMAQPRIRLEHKITVEQTALLAVVLDYAPFAKVDPLSRQLAAEDYVLQVMQDKFGTRFIGDISNEPQPRGPFKEPKSDLETLRDTLAARINTLRRKADLTIADMHKLAGLAPDPSATEAAETGDTLSAEPVTAGAADDDNEPF